MKVAKYIFHLSFQLAGAKLFLSGNFRREGRKAASISVCKHVPHAAEVSLRSGWFGKPKYHPSCRRSTACWAGIRAMQLQLKYQHFSPAQDAPGIFTENRGLHNQKVSYRVPPEFSKGKGILAVLLCHFKEE